jgi:hypothetical protein
MILEDWVMLGKSVPESTRDGRIFVCAAGWSVELRQFVRIYPMGRYNAPPRWGVCRVPLERNPEDSRWESFKLRGDRSPEGHPWINRVIQVTGTLPKAEAKRLAKGAEAVTLADLNERRRSLAVVRAIEPPVLKFEENPDVAMAPVPTPDMMAAGPAGPARERFRFHPRLRFSDARGKHDLALREWGCYELMRKRGDDDATAKMAMALRLDRNPPLLVGNHLNHRTAWLVIAVLTGLAEPSQASLPGLETADAVTA